MNERTAAWKRNTDHLPKSGNQIYIHVPFCPFYCHFCPLYKFKETSGRSPELREAFVQALIREIRAHASRDDAVEPFNTIYFGGGTPTELSPEQLCRILQTVREVFPLSPGVEVTLEGVATQMLRHGYLEKCIDGGFNRITFGVQSFDPEVRKIAGRGESVGDYSELVDRIRHDHPSLPVNFDMMMGLPGQSLISFERDLDRVVELAPDSLDIYSYWMVPGTRLYDAVTDGRKDGPEYGELLLSMRRAAHDRLEAAGYRPASGEALLRSEKNRFIQTTFGAGGNCLNMALGFGPSAIGFLNGTMYRNCSDLHSYLQAIEAGSLPISQSQSLNVATARRRAILFGIQRLTIPKAVLDAGAAERFEEWERAGLVAEGNEDYTLTREGIGWYNMMQLALLPRPDAIRMARLLGSVSDQASWLFARDEDRPAFASNLIALIRGENDLRGKLRLFGYKVYLLLHNFPGFDRRALSFADPVQELKPSHLVGIAPAKGVRNA